ncbi:MAG: ComF family protein [Wenzhouxiangellaceae bacterium]|nr:ComF family protein [Wenzhouxiangellaceae bacterium]
MSSGLWPPRCVVCALAVDDRSAESEILCATCAELLPIASGRCARCTLPLARDVDVCGRCLQRPPAFDAAYAAWLYQLPVSALVQRFKFHGALAEGRVLAEGMAARLAEQAAPRPQLLVPVPLHWRRRWRRGYNQSELLCRDLSARLGGLPWAPLLTRLRPTPVQSALPASRRRGNVRDAFSLQRMPPGLDHVALVDDVMTTGATLDECARVLKRAGVGRVDVWVAARA